MNEIQRIAIEAALERTNGDKKLAASLLGITVQTIYRKLKTTNEAPLNS
jgi:transcriptional regulator with PAS, ATPase and Fis domain